MTKVKTIQSRPDFWTLFDERIDELQAEGRFGTANTYSKTRRSFSNFIASAQSESCVAMVYYLPLSKVDSGLILRYNAWLQERGVVRNSISFYNRILRALYNRAVRRHLTTDQHPFDEAYTGVDKTSKRAVDISELRQVFELELPEGSFLELARDLFLFSIAMRGMAFVDVAYLRRDQVSDNFITYERRKSGTRLEVHLEPLARQIIARHCTAPGSKYLFPILPGTSAEEDHTRYLTALNSFNRALKEIGGMACCEHKLSTYVARHSWATVARDSEVPLSVISEALGHSSEKMTRIYLKSLDSSLVDNANRGILELICK